MGTRGARPFRKPVKRDHPHAYGDKCNLLIDCTFLLGSSPRVWGQVLDESSPIVWLGIIPTRVGTRLNAIRNSASQKDHPNACGDKWYRDFKFPFARGSSPRVWGQATATEVSTNLSGIIPTRVGTSDRNACRVCKRWDHPHACGDKQDNVEETKQRLGSSPRVWGQAMKS